MIRHNTPVLIALLFISAVSLATCTPTPPEPASDNDDNNNNDDDDDDDDNDNNNNDNNDDVNPDAWYGCADLDDCFYLCRDDDDCIDQCRYDTGLSARDKWVTYRDCMNGNCAEFVEDTEDWNICMDDNCADPRDDCMTDRGRDPDYVKLGPDSNEVGEIATNIFWYDPKEKDHCFRDEFYKNKKAIILEMGAAW
jgi:hypothetical protein